MAKIQSVAWGLLGNKSFLINVIFYFCCRLQSLLKIRGQRSLAAIVYQHSAQTNLTRITRHMKVYFLRLFRASLALFARCHLKNGPVFWDTHIFGLFCRVDSCLRLRRVASMLASRRLRSRETRCPTWNCRARLARPPARRSTEFPSMCYSCRL